MAKKKNIAAVADDLVQSFDQLVNAAKRVVAADEKLQALETKEMKLEVVNKHTNSEPDKIGMSG